MKKTLRSLDRYARVADHLAIQRSPPLGRALSRHTDEYRMRAMRLRRYDARALICNPPYRAWAIRTVQEGIPTNRWRDVCATCVGKTSAGLSTMGIPYSYNGSFLTTEDRKSPWELTAGLRRENLDDLCFGNVNIGRNVRSSITRYLQGAPLTGHEAAQSVRAVPA